MFSTDDSQDPLRELILVIRRLASVGSGQPALFPDATVSPVDLVRDFDQRAAVARELYDDQLTPTQIESLSLLEQKLATMSKDGAEFDADIWTDEAVRTSDNWGEVRTLAVAVLDEFIQ